ncbi:MAG: hypothetical protein KFF73_09410 [Cyclobacteriaceae bacterium]|nr:hypothetical protein [Cyclobacteriaceae bacterium]
MKDTANQSLKIIFYLLILISIGCSDGRKPWKENEYLPVYTGKDVYSEEDSVTRTVPVIDRLIHVNKETSIAHKIKILSDSVSEGYFHGLEISILKLDSASGNLVLFLELLEDDDYDGPGSLPMYQSWYDFFQGSSGGINTTIILKETFLQRFYKGEWIDAVVFYYGGKEIGEWDHIFLDGMIYRY